MYAIIEVGAKQHNIKEDSIIDVEKQDGEEGKEIALDKVLLVADGEKVAVGRPYLKDAKVSAIILKHIKGKKTVSFKYRRRKASHWKKGHRQQLSRIKIKNIEYEVK